MFTWQHRKYWQRRKINWEQDYLLADGALNHPHRQMIIDTLAAMQWRSILEVGMGAGANLLRIQNQWPDAEVGGFDINEDAVRTAQKYLPKARCLGVGDPRDIFLSDKSIDVVMSDACLIYFGWWYVRKALAEMKRVSRSYLLLCELHSDTPVRHSRYNIHNYRDLLERQDCFDIQIQKIPKDVWPGTPWEQWGHIVTCQHV